ncbi:MULTISPECIES: glycerol-3-phosphate dehydrogenase/oxidase [unclassified Sphingopyxis]|jgi:glycerol-3-phosphate dehydrogenase|uniref:glycerol-3-phosphate dehydrogenase/oxidase n=1 Tax=unclassified Sphingopyxis TaxID=2614943 RepID=UPI0006C1013B|nr:MULTISPECIES: glycerol-3-phosphate dehydrogenase/oxidase [unclassified Sphingopyxis]USI77763.1 glycerol-3-phosphate dehydrogenase/oxidase [Sphingopyxis sp. USTB-05]GAO79875.1 aerobic glycerol-3-phosphate dehydrogenase [Sphingopyxis sp. C-1]
MNSMSLDARRRAQVFAELESRSFDLAVIGGGITGAGIARDAAMRGLSVALVEARDYASGTSSRSSKMIHGGLRYLAQGDIALVKEAASERQILRRIAPHLTRLSPFLIPTTNMAMTAKLRTGLWTFEKLGGVPEAEKHEVIGLAELQRREPLMRTERLNGAVLYPEFLTDDARLVLANIRSAQGAGAVVINHAAASDLTGDGLVATSTLGDNLGARIKAKLVVNAAGAWVDAVRGLEAGESDTRMSMSRGIHLVLPRARLPIEATTIIRAPDKRSIFAVPRGAFTYIGTTDVFHDGADYWPAPTREDIDYLLRATEAALTIDPIRDAEIVSLWSGVRPLIAQPGKKANEVSRKDEIWTSPSGMISIAGGKLSAYRAMAERVVDLAVERLGQTAQDCATADAPLPGGSRTARLDGLDPLAAERLAGLYGDEANEIVIAGGDVAAEARRAVTHEGAATLEDYWVRRSARAWFDEGAGLAALAPAAEAMGALLGWDDAMTAAQIAHCRAINDASRRLLGE